MWDENPTRQSLVIGFEREPAESEGLFVNNTFFQDIWSEVVYVIARAKVRSNLAFANLLRSEVC